ncbi:MAG: helix-turn-helix transcriptional regulator [Gammaproteobacteria bacterium]|nr:helix-turn-helix transcriptional regulator [Gammaproteobacteria bacterium]
MEKRLNIKALRSALEKTGMNASALAEKLEVSREAVSKWLSGETFPRPDKLLRLGSIVDLAFGELIVREEANAPVIAFRKTRGSKTTDDHVTLAREMGRLLKELVPFLPFTTLTLPPFLKAPAVDYDYIQDVVKNVRQEIGVDADGVVDFRRLIRTFRELQTVLIPVFWGSKNRHENAIHVYLPDSKTTWVYLNLDTNVHDFLFWMSHELGHSLSPDLSGNIAEDFADAFAGALLFPRVLAERAYKGIGKQRIGVQINRIKRYAENMMISPLNVYTQINAYAESVGQPKLSLNKDIHPATTKFNQAFPNLSEVFFDRASPKPEVYIDRIGNEFETPFFEVLRLFLRETGRGPGFVQTVLDYGALDAKAIHSELI